MKGFSKRLWSGRLVSGRSSLPERQPVFSSFRFMNRKKNSARDSPGGDSSRTLPCEVGKFLMVKVLLIGMSWYTPMPEGSLCAGAHKDLDYQTLETKTHLVGVFTKNPIGSAWMDSVHSPVMRKTARST